MTTNQPDLETRLARLEELLADVGDLVISQNESIEALTANLNRSIEQADSDRQLFQSEINRIWQYLIGQQPGNGRET